MGFLLSGLLVFLSVFLQESLTLENAYKKAKETYPALDKIELQQKITALEKKVADSELYPQISISAKASYQSDVTEVNFTGMGVSPPEFSKDHYTIALDLTQPIYTGGVSKIRKKLEHEKGQQVMNSVQVEFHQVKEQINRVYFSAITLQQQRKSIKLLLDQLRQTLREVRSLVENGVLLPGEMFTLEAELISVEQDSIALAENTKASYEVLGELIGEKVSISTPLHLPEMLLFSKANQYDRPEYDVFQSSKDLLKQQESLTRTDMVPKISAFSTAAYGRPGLNVFDNDLQPYYIVGVKIQWNFWDWFNARSTTEAIGLRRNKVKADELSFTRQLNTLLQRTESDIRSMEKIIEKDEELIRLRKQVAEEAFSRLSNGAITAVDYVRELTRANEAELAKDLHKMQLVQKKVEYLTKMGKSW